MSTPQPQKIELVKVVENPNMDRFSSTFLEDEESAYVQHSTNSRKRLAIQLPKSKGAKVYHVPYVQQKMARFDQTADGYDAIEDAVSEQRAQDVHQLVRDLSQTRQRLEAESALLQQSQNDSKVRDAAYRQLNDKLQNTRQALQKTRAKKAKAIAAKELEYQQLSSTYHELEFATQQTAVHTSKARDVTGMDEDGRELEVKNLQESVESKDTALRQSQKELNGAKCEAEAARIAAASAHEELSHACNEVSLLKSRVVQQAAELKAAKDEAERLRPADADMLDVEIRSMAEASASDPQAMDSAGGDAAAASVTENLDNLEMLPDPQVISRDEYDRVYGRLVDAHRTLVTVHACARAEEALSDDVGLPLDDPALDRLYSSLVEEVEQQKAVVKQQKTDLLALETDHRELQSLVDQYQDESAGLDRVHQQHLELAIELGIGGLPATPALADASSRTDKEQRDATNALPMTPESIKSVGSTIGMFSSNEASSYLPVATPDSLAPPIVVEKKGSLDEKKAPRTPHSMRPGARPQHRGASQLRASNGAFSASKIAKPSSKTKLNIIEQQKQQREQTMKSKNSIVTKQSDVAKKFFQKIGQSLRAKGPAIVKKQNELDKLRASYEEWYAKYQELAPFHDESKVDSLLDGFGTFRAVAEDPLVNGEVDDEDSGD